MPNRFVRYIFDTWESLFHKMFRLQEIEPGVEHLFYIARRRYIGRPFTVDGVDVRFFDPIIELHMNNDMLERNLRQDENTVRAMIQLIRQARQKSIPALVRAIQDEKYNDCKAFYGITLINRGIERFGFQTRPLEDGMSKRMTTWHLKNILKMLNPDAKSIIQNHPDMLEPKMVVASKYSLISLLYNGSTNDATVADVVETSVQRMQHPVQS